LLQLARRFVHCDHVAEDVVQDAMLSALQALPTFEGRARVATWLHRIVVNAALMHVRRNQNRRSTQVEEEQEFRRQDDGPLAAAERADSIRHLASCLDRLPEPYRNAVELRDIQGRDTAEAAMTLGISENALKIRLHRARRALRELFEARQAERPADQAPSPACPILEMPRGSSARRAG
jgi:RNA polymerase sigma-70 factor (ECF subfamily)